MVVPATKRIITFVSRQRSAEKEELGERKKEKRKVSSSFSCVFPTTRDRVFVYFFFVFFLLMLLELAKIVNKCKRLPHIRSKINNSEVCISVGSEESVFKGVASRGSSVPMDSCQCLRNAGRRLVCRCIPSSTSLYTKTANLENISSSRL